MIEELLNTPSVPELGPGVRKGVESEAALNARLEPLLAKAPKEAAELIRGTVLLWHDHLEAAHTIAQGIETADGSYLHAIMHRREPDYSNAKYWFQRVGKHPCFARLAELERGSAFVKRGEWDPFAFVDACEREPGSGALRELQAEEIRLLLDHFLLRAGGTP